MSRFYNPSTDGLGPYGRPQGDPNYGQPLSRVAQAREQRERAIRAENRVKGQGDPDFDYEIPNLGPVYDGGPFDPNTGPMSNSPFIGGWGDTVYGGGGFDEPVIPLPAPIVAAPFTGGLGQLAAPAAAPVTRSTRKKTATKGRKKNIQPRNRVQSSILGGTRPVGR